MKLIYVEWEDAVNATPGWRTKDEIDDWIKEEAWFVKSVGWVLDDTPKHIVICSTIHMPFEDYEEQFNRVFKIPKGWIRKKRILKV